MKKETSMISVCNWFGLTTFLWNMMHISCAICFPWQNSLLLFVLHLSCFVCGLSHLSDTKLSVLFSCIWLSVNRLSTMTTSHEGGILNANNGNYFSKVFHISTGIIFICWNDTVTDDTHWNSILLCPIDTIFKVNVAFPLN